LLTEQLGFTKVRVAVVEPLANKELTQERVERLLLTPQLLTSTAILLVKCSEEPLEDEKSSLLRIGFLGGSDEDGGVFGPIGGIFGQGSRG